MPSGGDAAKAKVLQRCNRASCRTAGGFRMCDNKCVLLWGRRAREIENLSRLERNIITGGNAALLVEKMVFICLKNLGYAFVQLNQIRSVEGNHRMGENQF